MVAPCVCMSVWVSVFLCSLLLSIHTFLCPLAVCMPCLCLDYGCGECWNTRCPLSLEKAFMGAGASMPEDIAEGIGGSEGPLWAAKKTTLFPLGSNWLLPCSITTTTKHLCPGLPKQVILFVFRTTQVSLCSPIHTYAASWPRTHRDSLCLQRARIKERVAVPSSQKITFFGLNFSALAPGKTSPHAQHEGLQAASC